MKSLCFVYFGLIFPGAKSFGAMFVTLVVRFERTKKYGGLLVHPLGYRDSRQGGMGGRDALG